MSEPQHAAPLDVTALHDRAMVSAAPSAVHAAHERLAEAQRHVEELRRQAASAANGSALRRVLGWPIRRLRRALGVDGIGHQRPQIEALGRGLDTVAEVLGALAETQTNHNLNVMALLDVWMGEHHGRLAELERVRSETQGELDRSVNDLAQLRVALDQNAADHAQITAILEQIMPSLEHVTRNAQSLSEALDRLTRSHSASNERLEMLWRGADRKWGLLHEEEAMVERFTPFFEQSRGPEETIRCHQSQYLAEFAGKRRVVDLGCGRGEFLDLLREAGVDAEGIDHDPKLVEHCSAKGLRVTCRDLLDWLVEQPDESLDGVFCAQVVEHLPLAAVDRLVAHAARVLVPDGRLILETLNPSNLNIFMGPYWADPQHRQPIHHWTLSVICQTRGFMENRLVFSAPPPAEVLLPLFDLDQAPPERRPLLEHLNAVIRQLNDSLYGPGQFAVISRKGRPEELIPPT